MFDFAYIAIFFWGAFYTGALVVTCVLTLIPCLAGNLDWVAPVAAVSHLVTYGAVNFVCFLLALMKGSVFRPRWGHYR